MAEPITIQKLTDASIDADTLGEFANEDKIVTSRLGAEYPSAPMASRLTVENGLLGATPFSTYADMAASALVDGDYAVVSNDPTTIRNGIYEKVSGSWVYSEYNEFVGKSIDKRYTSIPLLSSQTLFFPVDDDNNLDLFWGVVDQLNNVGIGVDKYGSTIVAGAQFETLSENSEGYEYVLLDNKDNVALGVKSSGFVDMPNNKPSGNLAGTNGDIYYVNGSSSTRLTTDGLNQAPCFLNNQEVGFVSDKSGRLVEYSVDLNGSNERVSYADVRGYEQVIITGQSLAEGKDVAISTSPPYANNAFMFDNGAVGVGNTLAKPALKSLVETGRESIGTGFGKKLLSYALDKNLLVSGQAWGGASYAKIKKNGEYNTYSQVMQQVKFGNALYGSSSIKALFLIHGEADGFNNNTNYANNLRELLDDYNSDVKAANNQTDDIVMLFCQTSSASGYKDAANRSTFVTPFEQLAASQTNKDMYLVAPKYQFNYIDHAHIDATSTRTLGEMYAKVYQQVVTEGKPWKPLQPNNISVVGNNIVIDFYVPKAPLVIDTTLVSEGADNLNKGFVIKDSGSVAITSVAKTGETQVTISLSAPPPSGATLSYAFDNGTYQKSGREQGARGNIRDSETELSAYTSAPLYNWCVTFKHTF